MGLSDEQERAVEYVTNTDSNIKNIQGYAGSGKSYTVKAIAQVFDQLGFSNRGLALSGQVADNLSKDCGI
jgi:ABC-type dipeptide/oligopeptide/nickel transport system ATPase component